jgi:Flp pilus assembly protein TadB
VGAADRRHVLVVRQRELVSRHEILEREDPGSERYEDLELRVFDAADDLMRELDRARARAASRRRVVAYVLAVAAVVPVLLVAAEVVPSLWLVAAAVTGAVAGVLWLTARRASTPPAPAVARARAFEGAALA